MKIGYPCINRSVGCTPNTTFRLASYSEERLIANVKQNLECLKKTLEFNVKHKLFFFRIGSPLVPFASHPVCKFNWQKYFKEDFRKIGGYIRKHNFRISMHPDQFVLINAIKKDIVEKSIKELDYHCDVLDLLGLDESAKVQIHVGGVYEDKKVSIARFIKVYKTLSEKIKKRLVIENDHLSYSAGDCLEINKATGIPIVFDNLHHLCNNNQEDFRDIAEKCSKTWKKKDGCLMIDYSDQKINERVGTHAEHIDLENFKNFLKEIKGIEADVMLEIKDKEKSALEAVKEI